MSLPTAISLWYVNPEILHTILFSLYAAPHPKSKAQNGPFHSDIQSESQNGETKYCHVVTWFREVESAYERTYLTMCAETSCAIIRPKEVNPKGGHMK